VLDVGCGEGELARPLPQGAWVGVDSSPAMLARAPSPNQVADATALPFEDGVFDAVVSMWTHTDVDDFPAVVREVGRVLRERGPFVYVGAHPCFVGPHSVFPRAIGVPTLHPGYRRTGRYSEGPGVLAEGLRAKVGATHLPLGLFVQAFVDTGFRLEHLEELPDREYPYMVATRWRR
jgi:SAM-dependent methyltransferase